MFIFERSLEKRKKKKHKVFLENRKIKGKSIWVDKMAAKIITS